MQLEIVFRQLRKSPSKVEICWSGNRKKQCILDRAIFKIDRWRSGFRGPIRIIISDCNRCLELPYPIGSSIFDLVKREPIDSNSNQFNQWTERFIWFHIHSFDERRSLSTNLIQWKKQCLVRITSVAAQFRFLGSEYHLLGFYTQDLRCFLKWLISETRWTVHFTWGELVRVGVNRLSFHQVRNWTSNRVGKLYSWIWMAYDDSNQSSKSRAPTINSGESSI